MNDYLQVKELYHHGIKGQKWGAVSIGALGSVGLYALTNALVGR